MSDDSNQRPEERIVQRLGQLKERRRDYEDEWKDITKYVYPRRNGWEDRDLKDKLKSLEVYDNTATQCLTLVADGMLGHLVPASIPFFRLRPAIERFDDHPVLRKWLDDVERHILQVLERSNYYLTLGELFPDCAGLGTAVAFMEEDVGSGLIMFSARHLKEVYISEDRFGNVDTVYRLFEMSLRNLVDQFGDKVGEELTRKAKTTPDERVEVVHAVEPSPDKDDVWDSSYVLYSSSGSDQEGGTMLDTGTYDLFPYIVWRYTKSSDEEYGRSPAFDAMPDIIMINHQSKTMADAAQKAVNPPLLASDAMRGKIKVQPGAITYYDGFMGQQTVQSLYGGALGQYPLGVDAYERRAKAIREMFRAEFFNYLLMENVGSTPQRTATEVNAIEAQKAAVLGATVGRVTKELFEPTIHFVFQTEYRAKRLPDVPKEIAQLVGLPLEIEYTGPLAQKQRQYLRSQGIMDGAAVLANLAQFVPGVLDIVDWDGAAKEGAQANGMPQRFFLDPRVVDQTRQARAQQQAALQQAQLQIEAAKAAPDPNKAPEPGSPAAMRMEAAAAKGGRR